MFKPIMEVHQVHVEFSTLAYDLDRGEASWYCTTKHRQGKQVKVTS